MDYSKQVKVLGKQVQQEIRETQATVIGAGGLGNFTSISLALLGVKEITLIDFDEVEASNLHRQPLFSEEHVGEPKVKVAKEKLEELNPDVEIKAVNRKVQEATKHVTGTVFDGTDNFISRYFINKLVHRRKLLFFHAAVSGYQGQVLPVLPDGPCLKCVFPRAREEPCWEVGAVPSFVQQTSSVQVNEFIKYLTKKDFEPSLITIDFKENTVEKSGVSKRKDCSQCQEKA